MELKQWETDTNSVLNTWKFSPYFLDDPWKNEPSSDHGDRGVSGDRLEGNNGIMFLQHKHLIQNLDVCPVCHSLGICDGALLYCGRYLLLLCQKQCRKSPGSY